MRLYRRLFKRWADVVLATFMAILTSPILCIAAAVSMFAHGRPVLFRQERAGLNGAPFTVLKLRTMGHSASGQASTKSVTRIGRILRQTSIDELPQLFNVIRGDMSLVGPRPLHTRYVDRYSPEQRIRLEVAPGLTGAAQVAGRNSLTWEQKFELDTDYVHNLSFRNDARILFQTLGLIGRSRHHRSATEPASEFLGTGAEVEG